jgi:Methyltransferase FkbM domain
MLASTYRKLLPLSVRQSIYDKFLGQVVFFFRNFSVITRSKITWMFNFILPKNETNIAFTFMGRHGITSYPYPYMLEYLTKEISVEKDAEKNLLYILHNGKKLYFPEFYDVEKVKKDYRALLIEQDPRAAHRYVRSYDELNNRTLIDVGAAEASFALDTIELTRKVIIFECMEHWQKPLQATFAPWQDKVSVVKKYVGNKTSGEFVTLDDFLVDSNRDHLFIKMDIEGAERMALEGAQKILQTGKNIQVAVCTYHRSGDPEFMEKFLTGYGFKTEFSDGLMYWNKRLSKGMIRGKN